MFSQYVNNNRNSYADYNETVFFFRCTCDEGYTGRDCESEYIPCNPSPCQNGGVCRQRDKHTYTCDCPTGKFFGFSFERN